MTPTNEEHISTKYVMVLLLILGSFFWINDLRMAPELDNQVDTEVRSLQQELPTAEDSETFPATVQSSMIPK